MIIGLLSDTHDHREIAIKAVATLKARGATFFIHCGDVCDPSVLDCLAGERAAFVWGNCDWDRLALKRYAEAVDITCCGEFGELELAGKRIGIIHGDDRVHLDLAAFGGDYDYLFHGHTHVKRDQRVRKTRVINPGALYRATEKTVALLDLAEDRLEFIEII